MTVKKTWKFGKPFDEVDAISRYESGELDEDQTVELFQHLVDTGLAWQLQGHYGRMAANPVDRGLVHIHAR